MTKISIRIDPEFKALIPPLSPEEFAQLEENCVRDGIRDPLVVWPQSDGSDILIDGHNRWKIAAKHSGIRFEVVKMEFTDRDEAKAWILRNQLGRRNVDKWTKFDMAKQLEKLEKKKSQKRMSDGAKGTPMLAEAKGETRDKMAEMVGVSHGTYDKMKAIVEKATPEQIQQARSGEKSINRVYNEVMNKEIKRPPSAKEYAEQAKERHEDFKRQPVVSVPEVRQEQRDKSIIEQETIRRIKKTLSAITDLYILIDSGEVPVDVLSDDGKRIAIKTLTEMQARIDDIGKIIRRR